LPVLNAKVSVRVFIPKTDMITPAAIAEKTITKPIVIPVMLRN
jgi:hypothetical protein